MKKTLLILAATLAVTSSAFARPCRGYRRPCHRPCVVEHHHHHRSGTWHSEDWGKFIAGAAVGWLVNEALDTPPRREVTYVAPSPVYQPPVFQQPTYVAEPAYRQPVYQTIPATSQTIVSQPYAPPVQVPVQNVTVINRSTTVQVVQPTTIVRQFNY